MILFQLMISEIQISKLFNLTKLKIELLILWQMHLIISL